MCVTSRHPPWLYKSVTTSHALAASLCSSRDHLKLHTHQMHMWTINILFVLMFHQRHVRYQSQLYSAPSGEAFVIYVVRTRSKLPTSTNLQHVGYAQRLTRNRRIFAFSSAVPRLSLSCLFIQFPLPQRSIVPISLQRISLFHILATERISTSREPA